MLPIDLEELRTPVCADFYTAMLPASVCEQMASHVKPGRCRCNPESRLICTHDAGHAINVSLLVVCYIRCFDTALYLAYLISLGVVSVIKARTLQGDGDPSETLPDIQCYVYLHYLTLPCAIETLDKDKGSNHLSKGEWRSMRQT